MAGRIPLKVGAGCVCGAEPCCWDDSSMLAPQSHHLAGARKHGPPRKHTLHPKKSFMTDFVFGRVQGVRFFRGVPAL